MRNAFKEHYESGNDIEVFTAIYVRCGKDPSKECATVLLTNVRNSKHELMCDHIWVTSSAQWTALDLRSGDVVRFVACVEAYTKGYLGKKLGQKPVETDYVLSYIQDIRLIKQRSLTYTSENPANQIQNKPRVDPKVIEKYLGSGRIKENV